MKPTIKQMTTIGALVAVLEVAKHALEALPNVELVTLFLILYTLYFRKLVPFVIPLFVLVEGYIYGFHIWWVMYVYVWPLLSLLAYRFRKQESPIFWAVFSGIFGLCFGGLCSFVYIVTVGPRAAFAWWIAGIPYDLIHGGSNFLLCLVLFVPLRRIFRRVSR